MSNEPKNDHPNANLDKSHPNFGWVEEDSWIGRYNGWGGCWPGDGSGMDDLADFNQMEGEDY